MRITSIILFMIALVVTGVLGTETRLLFFWPGCALLGLAGLMAGARWRLRIHFPPSDWCLLSALLLALYLGLRAWLTPVAMHGREDLMLVLGCFTAYVLTTTVVSHPRTRTALLGVLLALAVGNLVVGFIHFSGRWTFHVVPEFVRTFGEGRIGGFYNNPNHLAAFFSFVLFLSLGALCFGRGGATWKLLLGFFVMAIAIGMALTLSRGAGLGLLLGAAVFAASGLWIVWKAHRHLFVRIAVGSLALTVLGGGLLWKVNEEYFHRRMKSAPGEGDPRAQVWRIALTQARESPSPLTGDGARSFYDGCFRFTPADSGQKILADALFTHNEYLQMRVDYGWLGIALLAGVILAHLLNAWRYIRWFVEWKFPSVGVLLSGNLGFAVGGVAALAATMVHALFEFHWHVPATAITGSIIMGMIANPGFEPPSETPARLPGVRPAMKLVMILASLVLTVGAATFGRADYYSANALIAAKDDDVFGQSRALADCLALDPRNADAWFRRGQLWVNQLDASKSPEVNRRLLEKAAHEVTQAIKLNPGHVFYRLEMADILDAMARHDEAREQIEKALEAAPNHEEPRLALAVHLHRLRKFAEAEQAILRASKATAINHGGTLRWIEAYEQLKKDAAAAGVKLPGPQPPM